MKFVSDPPKDDHFTSLPFLPMMRRWMWGRPLSTILCSSMELGLFASALPRKLSSSLLEYIQVKCLQVTRWMGWLAFSSPSTCLRIFRDARAEILRKNFVFKIVPMLNPDGVYHGHHRMDIFNQNLNRYYLSPCPLKQPSAFAVRHLGSYYKMDNRLCFYIDLHAHPQRKGNFIYGNSLEKQDDQIETQLFAKILSLNCI